jgi:hypothetical protein
MAAPAESYNNAGAICSTENRYFPYVVSCDEIALWKILLLGEIQS